MAYELSKDDGLWIDWVNSLPGDLRGRHDKEQAVSISAFKAGLAIGRAERSGASDPDTDARITYHAPDE